MPQTQTGVIEKPPTEAKQEQVSQIPEAVSELLKPISGKTPTGQDASAEEEYFLLDMEIGKASPDYKQCIELSIEILQNKSKDLRVASWLCFAWYRYEKLSGFENSLILILELLKKYSDKLFPENPRHRSKALQYLNTGRFVKLFERENIDKDNAPSFEQIDVVFQQLVSECKNQFSDQAPDLNALTKVLNVHLEEAKQFHSKGPAQEQKTAEKEKETSAEKKETKPGRTQDKSVTEKPEKTAAPATAERVSETEMSSEKDVIVTFKKALKFWFQTKNDEKIKSEEFIFGISRSLIWGRSVLPPHKDNVTLVNAPEPVIQSTFQGWISNREWDKLISAVETNFLNEDGGFKYWLTAQRYETLALEQKGGRATRAADEVKYQLARLIKRFPDITGLKFKNKLPFADEDTLKWIEEEVMPCLESGKSEEVLLPPIIGEDYEPINEEYKIACAQAPDKFEENIGKMQQGISGETRRKGRFLRTLNLANYCVQSKQFDLAKVHLTNLLTKIEAFQLTEWEPALSTAVWESAYLVNLKLAKSTQDPERIDFLEKQQKNLFTKIGNFDGVLALKLANCNSKKGG